MALCHYKLDFNDISQEMLDPYVKKNPESATAVNLQACNQYRLFNGKAAEVNRRESHSFLTSIAFQNDLRLFLEKLSTSYNYARDLFRHNMVVFQSGQGALQVLPSLVDVIPEARLNLVIYYLKEGKLQ